MSVKVEHPEWVEKQFPLVREIWFGCWKRTPVRGNHREKISAVAHAHTEIGIICFDIRHIDQFESIYPTTTFLHEYAHLMTPAVHHGRDWRVAYQALLDAYYPGKRINGRHIVD